MKKIFIGLLVVAVLGIAYYALGPFWSNKEPNETSSLIQNEPNSDLIKVDSGAIEVDYQAAFAIFTQGTFRVFTAAMYHNQSQDIYLDKASPNLIQVKVAGQTWDDFFSTLPFELTPECLTTGTGETFCTNTEDTLRFYLNGQEDPEVLDRVIEPLDRLLVTYGSSSEQQIQTQMNKIPKF